MGAWHTRGLRGSVLEECINFTNDYYRQKGIAVIQKIPTPITPVEMNKENNTPFKAEDVNWDELAGIGILKDELEMSGELDTLLRGEKTKVMPLSLVLLGVDVVMDATLQLVRKDGDPLLEILGIKSVGE